VLELKFIASEVIDYLCFRRRTHHAAPVTRPHMANGAVKSCRCHLANNGSEAEPWRVAVSDDDDDDDFPSVNSVLVENENCDTKVNIIN